MSEHTPGPWRVTGKCTQGMAVMSDRGDDSLVVAIAIGPRLDQVDDLTRADANLIASAPDLLAACERLDEFGDAILDGQFEANSVNLAEMIAAARAAIARARGQAEVMQEPGPNGGLG